MHFTKLFSCILDSSIWELDQEARLLWITLMSMADVEGIVRAVPAGLARRARISQEGCEAALALFLAPDPDSRSMREEGRRLLKVDGGWLLVNHTYYKGLMSAEATREKDRVRAALRRQNKASPEKTKNASKTRQVEVEVEAEEETEEESQIEPTSVGSLAPAPARVRDKEPALAPRHAPLATGPRPEPCDHARQSCEEIGCEGPALAEPLPDPFTPPDWAVEAAEGVSMGTGKRFADVAAIWRVFFAWAQKESKPTDRLQWRYWLAKETVFTARKRGAPPVGEHSEETRRLIEKAGGS